MKEYHILKTNQIRIFPMDDIDILGLNRISSFQKMFEVFSLQKVNLPAEIPSQSLQLIFHKGEFNHDNTCYLIDQLSIEDRRIIITISASSEIADIFYEKLKHLMIALDSRQHKGKYLPQVTTCETTCILKMKFKFDSLLSNAFSKSFKPLVEKASAKYSSEISIEPFSVRFLIHYDNIKQSLLNTNVSIGDKFLAIERRENTSPDEGIFYTVSPTDTDTHFKLLEIIENT